ncbi:MAG: alpha/beta fold hydrolase BchO [Pseudomonadota bacterium]
MTAYYRLGDATVTGKRAHAFVPADWPNREYSRMHTSYGTQWHVQRAGSGPLLLLIHGTAASTHSFRDLLPALARNFDVLAFDLPGHGYTSRLPDRSMSLPAISRGIAGLLETLDVSPEYLVGHSAGAAIALRLALDGAAGVRKIVGLNAALLPFGGLMTNLFSPLAYFFASTRLMPYMLARRAADGAAVERVIRGTGSVLSDEGLALYQRLFRREEHIAAVLAMMAAWDLSKMRSDLERLEPRLLLVSGGRDRAVDPAEAGRVAQHIAGAEVALLEDCGHLAHEEQPARISAIIRDFLTATQGECGGAG